MNIAALVACDSAALLSYMEEIYAKISMKTML